MKLFRSVLYYLLFISSFSIYSMSDAEIELKTVYFHIPEVSKIFETMPLLENILLDINVDKEENKKITYPSCIRTEGIAPSQYGTKGLVDSRLAEVEEKYDLNADALINGGFGEEGEDSKEEAEADEEESTADEVGDEI